MRVHVQRYLRVVRRAEHDGLPTLVRFAVSRSSRRTAPIGPEIGPRPHRTTPDEEARPDQTAAHAGCASPATVPRYADEVAQAMTLAHYTPLEP